MLCRAWEIEGIALSAGLTAAVGTTIAFGYIRQFVDVPWKKTILTPILCAAAVIISMTFLDPLLPHQGIYGLAVRIFVESAVFLLSLLFLEGKEIFEEFNTLRGVVQDKDP